MGTDKKGAHCIQQSFWEDSPRGVEVTFGSYSFYFSFSVPRTLLSLPGLSYRNKGVAFTEQVIEKDKGVAFMHL